MNKQMNDLYSLSRSRLFFILGPCVLETYDLARETALETADICSQLGVQAVFKSSFDKANRTSGLSFRGPGLEQGLEWLDLIRQESGLPVITDIHYPHQAQEVARVVDVIQIPAFLCRQTDLLEAAADTGKIVNIKKGQFMAPWDMSQAADKVMARGNSCVWLTERGTTFGYNNLVVDFRGIPVMQQSGHPVVFDATHSVQLPGGQKTSSGGQRGFVPQLARAAAAAGANGIFMEVHPQPDQALCDGPNSWPLNKLKALLKSLADINKAVKSGH
ncbi:MAG: 3-deoxy-8-phosphooctulonate synthase [Desulfonatronovibrionaceae bacterium]